MRPKPLPNYLAGYPETLVAQARQLIEKDLLADMLLQKYPHAHAVRTDRVLYSYAVEIKDNYLRNAGQLSKVVFDNKLHIVQHALGTHTRMSKQQGAKLRARREIRVATLFKEMPAEFLRMIVVHELAHLKEMEHNKAFYQLCRHMEPDYHQLELDLRMYLTYLETTGQSLWSPPN